MSDKFDKSLATIMASVLLLFIVGVLGCLKCSQDNNASTVIIDGQRAALIQTCLQQGHKPLDCTYALNRRFTNDF